MGGDNVTVVFSGPTNATISQSPPGASASSVGPQGPPGVAGATPFEFTQVTPASTWTVAHNLGRYVSVTLMDLSGNIMVTDVAQSDVNTIHLTFPVPTSGMVVCS